MVLGSAPGNDHNPRQNWATLGFNGPPRPQNSLLLYPLYEDIGATPRFLALSKRYLHELSEELDTPVDEPGQV